MLRRPLALFFFLAGLVAAGAARAETVEELDARLEAELGAIAPDAVSPFHDANRARLAGDHKKARALLGQVMELAPTFVAATRRACQADFELGRRADAIALCRRAVAEEHAPLDDVTLAIVLTSRPASGVEIAEARGLARRALAGAGDDLYVIATACDAAEDASDVELIQEAADRLPRSSEEPRELVCQAVAAATRGQLDLAERLTKRAERAGAPEDVVEDILEGIRASRPAGQAALFASLVGAASLLGALALAVIFAIVVGDAAGRRARAGRATLGVLALATRLSLRWLAAVEVVAIAGWLAFAAAVIGVTAQRWKIQGIAPALGVGAAVLVLTTLGARKLLWRRDDAPGLWLSRSENPGLYALADEAAGRVDAPVVGAIYLVPDVAIAAFERGGLVARVVIPGERCLVIGAGGLVGLRTSELGALLGRELAGLRRGGAGGAFARAFLRAFGDEATRREGWWLTQALAFLFARASRGAIAADDGAAGDRAGAAFDGALLARARRHLVRREIRHRALVDALVEENAEAAEPIENLYAATPKREIDTRAEVTEALARLAPAAGADDESEEKREDDPFAWTLLADRDALERTMTKRILGEAARR